MAFWIISASVWTIEVMVDVSLCCLFGRTFVVVVVECIRWCSVVLESVVSDCEDMASISMADWGGVVRERVGKR